MFLKPSLNITRAATLSEIKTELKRRRKDWRMADPNNKIFFDPNHQKQFDTLLQIGCIISAMSNREYIDLVKRSARQIEEKEAEKENLFNNPSQ